jgi:DNA-binding transcriptional LysR family regulator
MLHMGRKEPLDRLCGADGKDLAKSSTGTVRGMLMSGAARKPTLECLYTFLLFAEMGEAAAVADAIGLDPAVVSRRLKELRTRYGLLHKQGTRQALTPAGVEVLPAVRALLRQYEHLAQWLAGRQARPQLLVVAVGSLAAQLHLPRALALLVTRLPGWQVQVKVCRGRERILGTADGTYDLAVVTHDRQQIQSVLNKACEEGIQLEVEDLAEEGLCLIARQGSPAGERLAQSLESQTVPVSLLADYELIGLDSQSGIRRQLERAQGHQGKALHFRLEAGGWAAARECVRRGLGVAVVPLSLLQRDDRKDFVIRRLAEDVCIRSTFLYRRETAHTEHEALRQAIREAFEAQRRELQARWQGIFLL